MSHSNKILSLYLIVLVASLSCSVKNHVALKAKGYSILANEDTESKILADRALEFFKDHTEQKHIVTKGMFDVDYKKIYLEVNPNSTIDYCIHHSDAELSITIKDKSTGIYLINQLLEALSKEDNRFKTSDLFPSTMKFDTNCSDFDFSYRDPHFANNLVPGNSIILGNNNVDLDWGIWGHNLAKVMKNISDTNVYALVNNVRNKNQFSFTSEKLLDHLSQHILDNFGNGDDKSYHFMIMPQDNNLVCMCDACTKIGNTNTSATPAVSYFIQKLSNKFPKHQFFTSSYLTTRKPPKEKLNNNTGVFLSTIMLKKGIELKMNQPKTADFVKELEAWQDITPNIYIWDYSANFDDYLTPSPVLYSLQKQLKFYKEHAVKGVFINGSGYDYSSFDDLKAFVSSALLKNTEKNVDELCASFFKKYYPENHQLLTDYYLSLEKSFAAKNKTYNLYGGIDEILRTYLDSDVFINFYDELGKVIPETSKEEKENLSKLYSGLSYTRLQIAYAKVSETHGCADLLDNKMVVKHEMNQVVDRLAEINKYPNLKSYKEVDGDLVRYINTWRSTILNNRFENLLFNESIEILSETDEGFEKPKYLNNGLPGFSNDYHQGWYISSRDLKIQLSTEKIDGLKKMEMRFLNNKRHSFYPPEKIEIWKDKQLIKTLECPDYDKTLEAIEINTIIDLTEIDNIKLVFKRNSLTNGKIAIDEIRILN